MTTTPPREQLPPLPEPQPIPGFYEIEARKRCVYTAEQMQAYAREALRAQAASVVPVGEYLANVDEYGGVRWIGVRPPHGTKLYSGAPLTPAHIPADVSPPQAPQAVGEDEPPKDLPPFPWKARNLGGVCEVLDADGNVVIGWMGLDDGRKTFKKRRAITMFIAKATKGLRRG